MKILLIARYFPPLDSIASLRIYSFAKYFQEAGHEVSVLTTDKAGQVVAPLDLPLSNVEVNEVPYFDPICFLGFDKKKLSLATSSKPSIKNRLTKFLKRIYQERLNERMPGRCDLWPKAGKQFLKKQKQDGKSYDLIVSSYGPPAAHILGRFAQKTFNAKWIADYRDLWLENHVFKGLFPFTYIESFIEKACVSKADGISTVSAGLKDVLINKFSHIPCRVIENGFEQDLFHKVESKSFSKNTLTLVYTGSIYKEKRDPSPLFKAIKRLESKQLIKKGSIEVLFYTSCAGNLDKLITEHNVKDYAEIMPPIPYLEALAVQKSADLLLFLEDPNPEIDGILTGKLFEYLYASPPIFAVGVTKDTAAGKLISDVGAGDVFGTDVEKIYQSLVHYLKFKPQPLSKNLTLIEKYSRRTQAQKFLNFVDSLDCEEKVLCPTQ